MATIIRRVSLLSPLLRSPVWSRQNCRIICSSALLHDSRPERTPLQVSSGLLFLDHAALKSQTVFHREFSSEVTSLEDDVNVHYEAVVKRLETGDIQLIDIREASELAEFGQITNSIHIPLGELADALNLPEDKFEAKYRHPKLRTSDDNIVFHCRSGVRSLKAIGIAKECGFSKARHFPGGWLEWAKNNNLPYA